jgi:ElaB/YqjD/DUF883 family membrane-anchored ribosome-binding protein
MTMDLNSLRTHVFQKTGIKIDTNDPIFALVALNDAVLSENVARHLSALHNATTQLQSQTAQLTEAGERTKKLLLQLRRAAEDTGNAEQASKTQSPATPQFGSPWHWIGAAAAISILSALLVLLGQAALGYSHAPAPAIAKAAPALTSEQIQLIQNGEKYAKIWPKLDPQTQEKLQELARE